jgi:hypothetical protein
MVLMVKFSCYGSHLPGDNRGSFDHVGSGERRFVFPNAGLERDRRRRMRQSPYLLSTPQARSLVRDAVVGFANSGPGPYMLCMFAPTMCMALSKPMRRAES